MRDGWWPCQENYRRLEILRLLWCHPCVGHYDNYVAGLNLTGSRSIQANHSASLLTGYGICVETLAIVVIDYEDPLTLKDVGGL